MWREIKRPPVSAQQAAFLRRLKLRRYTIYTIQILLLVGFFLLWEVAARKGWVDAFLFSQPTEIWATAVEMAENGMLWKHIGVTLAETVAGFVLGTILGTLTAILLWWNRMISDVAEPYLVVLNALPKTALAPIIIVWLGNGKTSIIVVALLTSVIVTIMTVLNGFLQTDEEKIKLIRIFGGGKWQILKKVVFPANIPCMVNALKINVGLSFVGVIVGEFLVAQAGLGFLIIYGSQVFKLSWVLMSVVILSILAALLYEAINLLEKRILKKTPLTKKDRTYKDSVFLFLFVFRYNPHHKAFFIVFVFIFEIFFKIILRQFQYKPHCCQACCHQKNQRTDDHNGFFPFFFYCQPQHHTKSANTGFDQCHVFPVAFQHIIIQKCCQLFHNIPAFLYLVTVSYVKSLSCPSKVN